MLNRSPAVGPTDLICLLNIITHGYPSAWFRQRRPLRGILCICIYTGRYGIAKRRLTTSFFSIWKHK
jgi:hypothetical protein